MPRDTIPIIEPFVIPMLSRRYVDIRDVTPRQKFDVLNIWCEFQRVRLGQIPGNIPSCGPNPANRPRFERMLARYNRALANRPGLTIEEWQDEGHGRLLETDKLLTKAQAFLACRDMTANEWIGGVPFTNITIESRTPTKITASIAMGTATPKHPDFSRARTNAIGTSYLLNNDLPLRNGKVLDIVQWNFTLPKAVEAAVLADPSIIANITQLGTEFDQLPAGPGKPIRFRRKGIASAPPDVEPPVDTDT